MDFQTLVQIILMVFGSWSLYSSFKYNSDKLFIAAQIYLVGSIIVGVCK
jgi:hypothetical protein